MSLRVDTSRAPRTYDELHDLLRAVEQAAAEDESEWIEWKSALDLSANSTRAMLARHIIGMANRRTDEAARFVEGAGYVLVGIEPGNRCGVSPVDLAGLRAGIASYLGPHGPRWTASYDSEDGSPVLIIIINPPCDGDPVHTLHRDFERYRAGDIFVRKPGCTERADPADIDYLTRRGARQGLPEFPGPGTAELPPSHDMVIPGHVFISYVREDSSHVDRLQSTLEAAGVRVWRDTSDLWPGEDWRARIRQAISGDALVFVACFSRRSLARSKSYQREELTLAIEQLRLRRPGDPWLIPVRFDGCEIPDDDIGGGRTLASIQRADLFGDRSDHEVSRLITTVLRILGKAAAASATTSSRLAQQAPDSPQELAWRPVGTDGRGNEGLATALRATDSGRVVQAPAVLKPHRKSSDQAIGLLSDAERLAQSILDKQSRARALVVVARTLAGSDPNRAAQLISDAMDDVTPSSGTYNEILEMMAAFDPDRAEAIARSINPADAAAWSLVTVIGAIAASDPDRAIRLAQSIRHQQWPYIRALERLVDVLALTHPDQAERIARSIPQEWSQAEAMEKLAVALAGHDPEWARRIAESISMKNLRASALAKVARAALATVAKVLADSDPDLTERLARSIRNIREMSWELGEIAKALARSDLDRAERVARLIFWAGTEARALGEIAEMASTYDPDRAERIARSITNTGTHDLTSERDLALEKVAVAIAVFDRDRAKRITSSITNDEGKVKALTGLAKAMLQE